MAHLTGCSIEKRRYTGGFHVEHHRRNGELIDVQSQAEPPAPTAIALDERNADTIRVELTASNTNVISKTCQCLRNHTVVYADGYKCSVQSGEAKIGLLHLFNRHNDSRIAVIDKPISNGKKIQQAIKSAQALFDPVVLETMIMHDAAVKRGSSVHPDALGSFVCGLGSMSCLFAILITSLSPFLLFIGLLAAMLLLAFLAGRKANRAFKDMHYARDRYTGKALAAAGMVMGVLSIVAFIGLVLIVIFGIAFTAFT